MKNLYSADQKKMETESELRPDIQHNDTQYKDNQHNNE
jgi:hypothetical protein